MGRWWGKPTYISVTIALLFVVVFVVSRRVFEVLLIVTLLERLLVCKWLSICYHFIYLFSLMCALRIKIAFFISTFRGKANDVRGWRVQLSTVTTQSYPIIVSSLYKYVFIYLSIFFTLTFRGTASNTTSSYCSPARGWRVQGRHSGYSRSRCFSIRQRMFRLFARQAGCSVSAQRSDYHKLQDLLFNYLRYVQFLSKFVMVMLRWIETCYFITFNSVYLIYVL